MIRDARQRTRPLKGAALLLGLIATALLIFFADGIMAAFERRYQVVVVSRAAPRVVPGTAVWIGGKPAGTVTRVAFMANDADTMRNVVITLELPRRHRELVRANSRVRMASARRISEPAVDITPGTTTAPALAPGDTLEMYVGLSFTELRTRGNAVRAELDTVLTEVAALKPAMGARVVELRRSFASIEQAMAETAQLRSALSTGAGFASLRDGKLSASLDRTRAHVAEISTLIASSRARMSNGELRLAFERLQQNADSLRAQLDAAAFETGFFARSRSDSALHHAIIGARTELDSLIAQTKRNPLRFFF